MAGSGVILTQTNAATKPSPVAKRHARSTGRAFLRLVVVRHARLGGAHAPRFPPRPSGAGRSRGGWSSIQHTLEPFEALIAARAGTTEKPRACCPPIPRPAGMGAIALMMMAGVALRLGKPELAAGS
jgi:hypothetical protein